MKPTRKARVAGILALTVTAVALPLAANATSGYFALAYGPVQRGAGGAGVANTSDAMGAAVNPASVATLGRELDFGVEIFMPDRGFTGDGTNFLPDTEIRSDAPVFPIPNFAYNHPLANGGVLNFAAYGNGGMNTTYDDTTNGNCGDMGVFCGGPAGVDLMQLFVSATYARKSGALSWGIAPTIAVQRFEATGLANFAGMSSDSSALTNEGYSLSTGFGLRGGIQLEVSPMVTLGLSGQTKFDMSEFDEYAGLFAGQGDFDIPASATVGLAVKASDTVNLMLDYQNIYYSGVDSISNPFPNGMTQLGADDGHGFGWTDVNVVKLGIEWAASPDMTWRAGYAHSDNPIGPEDVTFNVLAPGIVEDHFTFGGSKVMGNGTLDFAVMYAPSSSVSGGEINPMAPSTGTVTLEMSQFSASVGWRKTF